MNDPAPIPASWALRLRGLVVRWVGWSHDHWAVVLAGVLAVTSVAGFFAWKLLQNVETDFATLLPDSDRSVRDLRRIQERYGGSSTMSVMAASPDFEANKRFIEALSRRLTTHSDDLDLRSVRYREGSEREFLEKHKYLYVDKGDLDDIYRRLKARTRWEKCAKSPFCIQLDEKPEFTTDDIEAKYRRQTGEDEERNRDGYLSNAEGTVLALEVEARVTGSQFRYTKHLQKSIDREIAALAPSSFHPDMKTYQWGGLVKRRYEYEAVIKDTVRTAGLTLLLVFAAVYWYFRRFRPVFFMSLAVVIAIVWTFALTYWHIGYLNQQTAFLGSIIVGNGINFSLIFMARYLEERRRGEGAREALIVAARNTVGATVTAALATATAYGVLLFASFKGFSQFGFMGGVGMIFCWLATFSLVPALLALSERIRPLGRREGGRREGEGGRFGSQALGRLAESYPRAIVGVSAVLGIGAILLIGRFWRDPFEYDFRKLRIAIERTAQQKHAEKHFDVFSRGRTDAIAVLTDSPAQSALAVQALEEKKNQPNSTVDRVWWLGSLVPLPAEQEEKLGVIRKIRELVDSQPMAWLSEKQRQRLDEFRETLRLEPVRLKDVPERLLARLREKDGTLGRVVLVYPTRDIQLADGRNLIRFANEIRRLDLSNGTTLWTSGSPVIFADMLTNVIKDGPFITLICYLGVIGAIWLSFRSLRTTAFLMVFLTYGLLLLGGAMGLLDLKVNFFNYIVIPITVGIGVDYHINVYKRYELDGKSSIRKAVATTGGAVILCSLTTIIGYGTMMVSSTNAMVSFGIMAVIGEVTCLASALLFKPAILVLIERRRAGRAGALP